MSDPARTRHGTCVQCGVAFIYPMLRSAPRRACSPRCKAERIKAAAREREARKCSVSGCDKKTLRSSLCEMHYYRVRRNGALDLKIKKKRNGCFTSSGYCILYKPSHPLANKQGCVAEHRVVAFDQHGAACPDCFWCGLKLNWSEAVVDHLNEVKADNRPSNLAVSCNGCNRARGALLPFVRGLLPQSLERFITLVREQNLIKVQAAA